MLLLPLPWPSSTSVLSVNAVIGSCVKTCRKKPKNSNRKNPSFMLFCRRKNFLGCRKGLYLFSLIPDSDYFKYHYEEYIVQRKF